MAPRLRAVRDALPRPAAAALARAAAPMDPKAIEVGSGDPVTQMESEGSEVRIAGEQLGSLTSIDEQINSTNAAMAVDADEGAFPPRRRRG